MGALFPLLLAAGIALALLALWLVLRARAPAVLAVGAAKLAKAAHAPSWRQVAERARSDWRQLRRLLAAPAAARYRQPRIVLLGQPGAGKSSLVASLAWVQQHPEAQAQSLPGVPMTAWHELPGGLLVDPDGRLSGAPVGTPEAVQWLQALQGIAAQRPERALDGVVLVVSAQALLAADPASRLRLAQDARRQLQDLREQLRLVLPVYVVVSRCDGIAGFGACWRAFPGELRRQMQGWSAPAADPQPVAAHWPAAQRMLVERLRALQVQAAALQPQIAQADDFFLYPWQFEPLRDPIAGYLAEVFQETAWDQAFLCRGVYFTGNVVPPAAAPAGPRADVAFADDLFTAKVLQERGLARITRQAVFSRDRLLRRLQQAGVALAALLTVAAALAGWRLQSQVSTLVDGLAQLRRVQAVAATSGSCIGKTALDEALVQTAGLDVDLVYAVLPLSWVDRRPAHRVVRTVAELALQGTALPALRCGLEQRSGALALALPQPAQTPLAGLPVQGSTYARVRATLQVQARAVQELEEQLARFAWLAVAAGEDPQRALQALDALATYLYREALPRPVLKGDGAVLPALAASRYEVPVAVPGGMRTQFASQLQTLGLQLQAALLNEVAAGSQWLAQIGPPPKGPLPLAESVRGFAAWIAWTGQAWVPSTAADNPCSADARELERLYGPLVENYRYPSAILAALPLLGAERCYRPAMGLLQSARLERYGPVLQQQGGRWVLNPQLAAEARGLTALLGQGYMQVTAPRPFSCQHGTGAWRTVDIGRAEGYAREYQQFLAAQQIAPLGAPATTQPLYALVADYQLEQAMNDAMQSAQASAGAPPVLQGLEAVSAADQQLLAQSQAFARMLQPLLTVLRLYAQQRYQASGALVTQCSRDIAADALGRVSALANQSRLYDPDAGPADGPLVLLGPPPVVRDYLDRQVARAQVLTGYAEPFAALLRNTPAGHDGQKRTVQTLAYWTNTINELTRYVQFKEPNGQVGALDTLFLKTVAGLTYANCAKGLAAYQPPDYGDDLFSRRRQLLVAHLADLCTNRQQAQAGDAYRRLAERFDQELAGRYPFGPLDAARPEAALGTVKAFFLDYDGQRAALGEALAGVDRSQWKAPLDFVTQLDAVAAFLRGSLTSASSQPLRLAVAFHLRPAPGSDVSPGSNQVVNWSLSAGPRVVNFPGTAPATLDWPFGEALELDLTWADRSPWRPVDSAAGAPLVVRGSTATYAGSGNWALLRMLERFAPRRVPASDPLDPNRSLLELAVPVVRADGGAPPATAVLYLGLNLSAPDPRTQSLAPVRWPGPFPRAAPPAPAPSPRK